MTKVEGPTCAEPAPPGHQRNDVDSQSQSVIELSLRSHRG